MVSFSDSWAEDPVDFVIPQSAERFATSSTRFSSPQRKKRLRPAPFLLELPSGVLVVLVVSNLTAVTLVAR